MLPISLFGTGIKSYSQVACSQRRLNCYYDLRSDGDKSEVVVRGTPGLVLWFTLPTYPIRGWRVVANILYVVAGNTLYSVTTAGVYTALGTIATTTGNVSISDNYVQVMIVDSVNGYIFTILTSALTIISDVNFPSTGPASVTFIDGRFIVNDPQTRQFFVSASFDGTTWTPVMFGTKETYSDLLQAVDNNNGTIIMWGTSSVEFWQDVGAVGLPYTLIPGTVQNIGLVALWSRAYMGSSVLFLGVSQEGGIQIYAIDGYTPKVVSNPDIEQLIDYFTDNFTITDAVALTYAIGSHNFYQLTFPSANRTLLYDMTSNIWQEVQTGVAVYNRHNGNLGVSFNYRNLISDYSNGNIYYMSDEAYTDNGIAIKRQIATRHLRSNGNEFTLDEVFLDMETGNALQTGQGSNPQIVLQKSKDGGRTFGYERWKTLGLVGQYLAPRVIWRRNGRARDFVFQFTMTDPVQFVIAGSALTVDGSSEDSK